MTKHRPAVEVTCPSCGCHFMAQPCRLEAGESKFCSNKCRYQGWGYVERVLALLPNTITGIIKETGLPANTVQRILARSIPVGKCFIAKLVRVDGPRGQTVSEYECLFKPGRQPIVSILTDSIRDAKNLLMPMVVLGAMPGIQAVLSDKTGLSRATVSTMVKRLHKDGRCFIYTWKRVGRVRAVAGYKAGNKADAVCNIVPFTSKEKHDRFIAKKVKTGKFAEWREQIKKNDRIRHRAKAGDPYINALFGKPAERLKAA